jgi:hypothetical protein
MSQLIAEENGLLEERTHLLAALDRARYLINKRFAPMGLGYLDSQIAAIDRRLRQIAWERHNIQNAPYQNGFRNDDDPWSPLGW